MKRAWGGGGDDFTNAMVKSFSASDNQCHFF